MTQSPPYFPQADVRALTAITEAWPDRDIHYLFGGYVVLPKGTRVICCASTIGTLWERLMMTGPLPTDVVVGTVLHNYELTEGQPPVIGRQQGSGYSPC